MVQRVCKALLKVVFICKHYRDTQLYVYIFVITNIIGRDSLVSFPSTEVFFIFFSLKDQTNLQMYYK